MSARKRRRRDQAAKPKVAVRETKQESEGPEKVPTRKPAGGKGSFLSSGTLWLAGILIAGSAFVALRAVTIPAKVGGELSEFDEVSLGYESRQDTAISPLCGCESEQEPRKWRGVTFVARDIILRRTGGPPHTQYFIGSSYPGEVIWNTPDRVPSFKLQCVAWFLTIPKGEKFDPGKLLEPTLPATYQVERKMEFDGEEFLSIITEEEIHIALLGDKPLGAWIPATGSTLTMKFDQGMLPGSGNKLRISESYQAWTSKMMQNGHGDYPLGDFLGPNVAVWSADPGVTLATPKAGALMAAASKTCDHIMVVLITKPPWSARISCMPVSESWKSRVIGGWSGGGERTAASFVDLPGKVAIEIAVPDDVAKLFDSIYRQMKEDVRVEFANVPGRYLDEQGRRGNAMSVEFRYPPIPPKEGFNIFGSLGYMRFSSAVGKMEIGKSGYDLSRSEIELRGMTGLNLDQKTIYVPPVRTEKTNVSFHVESVNSVEKNGEKMNSIGMIWIGNHDFEYAMGILTFISAIGGIYTLRKSRKND